eukprot:s59_g93.t1
MEWSRAVWLLQQKRLAATDNQGLNWKFLSFWNPEESSKSCEEAKEWMAGTILTVLSSGPSSISAAVSMDRIRNSAVCPETDLFFLQEYWDSSAEAGPKRRPAERFQAEIPSLEVLTFNGSAVKFPNTVEESLGPKAEALQKKVKAFNEKNQAVLNVSGATAGNQNQAQGAGAQGTQRSASRTACNPVFVPPDAPVDYLRSVEPATTSPLHEFENQELMCSCKATSNAKLKVAIIKDTCEVWLVNESPDAQLEVAAGELFGFNVGSFTERSVGAARSQLNTCIPFLIATDLDLMVHVRPGEEKRLRCLAQLCAHTTQNTAVTELSLLDHDISQKTQDLPRIKFLLWDGNAIAFRYTVSPRAMINTFEPRSLGSEDTRDMRSSMMGAACAGKFKMLPKSQTCGIVWEVPWLD